MALCNSKSSAHFEIQQTQPLIFLNFARLTFFLFLLFPFANSVSFDFPSFNANGQEIQYEGDATPTNGTIRLTMNTVTGSIGRAFYSQPVHIWDNETGNLTDFNTHFSFIISSFNPNIRVGGDGLTFFLCPLNSTLPTYSGAGYLGLFESSTAFNDTNNQIVAVEFDTYQNSWDPSMNHVGIDVNSINSVDYLTWDARMANYATANAWVNYNSTTTTLSVYLTYDKNPVFLGSYSLSHDIDLSAVLPEWVSVGFSAATNSTTETHSIVSWAFNSTLGDSYNSTLGVSVSTGKGHKMNLLLMVGLVLSVGACSCAVIGLFWFMKRKMVVLWGKNEVGRLDASVDDDSFEKGSGPRRFMFKELSLATNNFAEGGKLGQGGFGGVYKGVLSEPKGEIAVKRISRGSKQGKKEYVSEVKIISRLRHRNLVQLIGWCHEQAEFLLIYEFMPNGSLDKHLFNGKSKLTWAMRHKIALGLASAVLYLHEEWEQCVIHRDIKSSNIMLDSSYNAKLGDFGLARLVDHEVDLETTVMAGTIGYLAPECVCTGKASKESDVYSFGVVALEIACGRKPMVNQNSGIVRLSEWVWSLYGEGKLCEAVDKDLTMEYDELQVERLMMVGLWCCHPDHNLRPSIRQVINVLTFEAPLPVLPSKMPALVYCSLPMCMPSYSSSDVITDSSKDRI